MNYDFILLIGQSTCEAFKNKTIYVSYIFFLTGHGCSSFWNTLIASHKYLTLKAMILVSFYSLTLLNIKLSLNFLLFFSLLMEIDLYLNIQINSS